MNPLNRGDWTPLMLTCTKNIPNTLAVVKILIDKGAKDLLVNKVINICS